MAKAGDVTDVPKITYSGADNFHDVSSRHLYDGTFARLKDITLGYEVPSKYLEGTGFDGVTFTLRGTNLYTWVKDSGLKLDPEVGNKRQYNGIYYPYSSTCKICSFWCKFKILNK